MSECDLQDYTHESIINLIPFKSMNQQGASDVSADSQSSTNLGRLLGDLH